MRLSFLTLSPSSQQFRMTTREASELIQISLPNHSIQSTFIPIHSTLNDLIVQILKEDGKDFIQSICGNDINGNELSRDKWGIQRCLKSQPNKVWKLEELEELNRGKFPIFSLVQSI